MSGTAPLLIAVAKEDAELITLLLEHGADPFFGKRQRNGSDITPLEIVARGENPELIKLMMHHIFDGKNVTTLDTLKDVILRICSDDEVSNEMKKHITQAYVSLESTEDESPLDTACFEEGPSIVEEAVVEEKDLSTTVEDEETLTNGKKVMESKEPASSRLSGSSLSSGDSLLRSVEEEQSIGEETKVEEGRLSLIVTDGKSFSPDEKIEELKELASSWWTGSMSPRNMFLYSVFAGFGVFVIYQGLSQEKN